MTKENIKAPNGWPAGKPWTEKDAAEADAAAGFGLSRDDFSDDGADLNDLMAANDLDPNFWGGE